MRNQMATLIVKENKVKTCEKCGGHWSWRQTKAGKWYPANAVYMGDEPQYGIYEVTYETIYHVDMLAHFKFCKVGA